MNEILEFEQASNDRLDYGFSWLRWLVDGDLVASSVWTAPSPLTVSSDSINSAPIVRCGISHPANTATATFLTGGISGADYLVRNTITTVQGRIFTRWLRLWVINAGS